VKIQQKLFFFDETALSSRAVVRNLPQLQQVGLDKYSDILRYGGAADLEFLRQFHHPHAGIGGHILQYVDPKLLTYRLGKYG